MRLIALQLHRGLGNRLLPLLSALAARKETGAAIQFVWNTYDPPLSVPPAPDPPYPFQVRHQDLWRLTEPAEEISAAQFALLRQQADPEVFLYDNPMPFRPMAQIREVRQQIQPAASLIDPLESLWTKVWQQGLNRGWVLLGVSIRQVCGYVKGTHLAPLETYQARLRELDQHLQGRLVCFVSADTAAGVDSVREVLGDRVVAQPKTHAYSSPEALKEAMIDIWALSRCHARLGPPMSTMVWVAHWLGQGSAFHTPNLAWPPGMIREIQGHLR